MSRLFLRACVWVVTVWTRAYTSGLPLEMREARRGEIGCDLWDHRRDRARESGWRLGLHLLMRMMLGVRDDLGWRADQLEDDRAGRRALVVAGSAAGVLLAAGWALSHVGVPPVPPMPQVRVDISTTPAPAPPPPPPAAPGQQVPAPIEAVYGRATYSIAAQGATPALVKEVRAVYPPILMAGGVEGVVIVTGRITESGRVADATVVQSHGLLTQSAFDAIQRWEFSPRRDRDSPDDALTVTVHFTRPAQPPALGTD
jgi:TonB family protein